MIRASNSLLTACFEFVNIVLYFSKKTHKVLYHTGVRTVCGGEKCLHANCEIIIIILI